MLGMRPWSISFIILNDPQMCFMENHLCQLSLQPKQLQEEAVETDSGSMAVTLTHCSCPGISCMGTGENYVKIS